MVKKRQRLEDTDTDSTEGFLLNMRESLRIDPHGLDEAWLEQPGLFHDIADRLALEISLRDEARDDIKQLESELDAVVRENHADDDKKPTETAIKNEIAADSSVISAKKKLRGLERNVNALSAMKESFMQRRYALQDLTSLYLGGYYQSNSGAARDARDRAHKSNREALHAERKRLSKD